MSARDETAVLAAMKRMDVLHLEHRSVSQLSGGERTRVLLARALAQETNYLIADEPAAGLDPAHALSLFEDLKSLANDGKAVITALHDLACAARYASRVLLFKEGSCICDGPADQVLSSQNLAEAFGIDAMVSQLEGIPVFLPRSALRTSQPKT
jgi:iron complex transport system ATP-binding protein